MRKKGSSQFDGRSTTYVVIPNTGKLDAKYSITVLVWMYPEGRRGFVFKYNSNKFVLRVISPRVLQVVIRGRLRRTTITVSTPGNVIRYKAWNYIGVTCDRRSNVVRIWVNSKPVAKTSLRNVQLDTRKDITLGGGNFRGRLFCLQVYSVPLSQRQIEAAKKKCFLKGEFFFLASVLLLFLLLLYLLLVATTSTII